MKKLLILLALGLFFINGFSQELKPEQVPQLIKDRVQFKFPQAMDVPVKWTKEKGEYMAKLTIMDAPATIVVDTNGVIKRVERRINENYLPDKAKKYLKGLDAGCTIIEVVQVTDEKENVTYKTAARIRTDFIFDGKGNTVAGKK